MALKDNTLKSIPGSYALQSLHTFVTETHQAVLLTWLERILESGMMEYWKDGRMGRADGMMECWKDAGYSPSTDSGQGCRMLKAESMEHRAESKITNLKIRNSKFEIRNYHLEPCALSLVP